MRNYWALISFLFILLTGCQNDAAKGSELTSLVPGNASYIIKAKSMESLKSAFRNNALLGQLKSYSSAKNVQQHLNFLDYLNTNEMVLLAFGKTPKDSVQFTLITKYSKNLLALDSAKNKIVESYTYNRLAINKTTLDDRIFYSAIKDSIFMASNDRSIIESAFGATKPANSKFATLLSIANSDKSISILINATEQSSPSFFMDHALNNALFSGYYVVDADVSQDQLAFNGITKAKDTTGYLINVFGKTVPQENQLPKICPANADGFLSFTFDNYKTFHHNFSIFRKDSLPPSPLFDTASEIGVVYKGNQQAVIVNSLDAVALSDLLLTQDALETFREVALYPFDQPELFHSCFFPLITFKNATKYANVDNFFIFADSDTLLKDIISGYQNSATLSESASFKSMSEQMSDESSLYSYGNATGLKTVLNENFSEDKTLDISVFGTSAIQFVQDHDFAHVHSVIKKQKGKSVSNTVTEDINVVLDNDLLTEPQLVKNHTNSQMDIVVQDVKNNLYLISNDGKVLWKKQIESAILGKIEQIDIYKNGRLQLAFATANHIYVLDRNGKDVAPFPIKSKNPITQPLSVFDYENKRDYRLMVVQGKNVQMYDKKAKIVTGFTYKSAKNTIETQPKHFRIGNKDYIVFAQGDRMEILDRTGKVRIDVKQNIDFSGNDIYLFDNTFTTTTKTGELIQIDRNGKVTSEKMNLTDNHHINATSKTLVTLSENILTIKSKKIELNFGDYTPPQIYYVNDKIYVATTDLQTNKAYLFDSQGEIIKNFPVYGHSTLTLDNINKDNAIEAVTNGSSNSIIIYRF